MLQIFCSSDFLSDKCYLSDIGCLCILVFGWWNILLTAAKSTKKTWDIQLKNPEFVHLFQRFLVEKRVNPDSLPVRFTSILKGGSWVEGLDTTVGLQPGRDISAGIAPKKWPKMKEFVPPWKGELAGGFKYFLFSSLLGEDSHFD